jgi:hypothetical protein
VFWVSFDVVLSPVHARIYAILRTNKTAKLKMLHLALKPKAPKHIVELTREDFTRV